MKSFCSLICNLSVYCISTFKQIIKIFIRC
nr:MAG TPA: hypothetical protein [Crassvirales sp.]